MRLISLYPDWKPGNEANVLVPAENLEMRLISLYPDWKPGNEANVLVPAENLEMRLMSLYPDWKPGNEASVLVLSAGMVCWFGHTHQSCPNVLCFNYLGRKHYFGSSLPFEADWLRKCSLHEAGKTLQHLLWDSGVLLTRSIAGKQVRNVMWQVPYHTVL